MSLTFFGGPRRCASFVGPRGERARFAELAMEGAAGLLPPERHDSADALVATVLTLCLEPLLNRVKFDVDVAAEEATMLDRQLDEYTELAADEALAGYARTERTELGDTFRSDQADELEMTLGACWRPLGCDCGCCCCCCWRTIDGGAGAPGFCLRPYPSSTANIDTGDGGFAARCC
jgi:hypothetical protein